MSLDHLRWLSQSFLVIVLQSIQLPTSSLKTEKIGFCRYYLFLLSHTTSDRVRTSTSFIDVILGGPQKKNPFFSTPFNLTNVEKSFL